MSEPTPPSDAPETPYAPPASGDADPLAPLVPRGHESPEPEPHQKLSVLGNIAAAIGVVLLALVLFVVLKGLRRKPPTKPFVESKAGVRVERVAPKTLSPRVEGYGRARPTRRVSISAEVGGRVARIHERLDDGERLAGGASVVEIDSSDATTLLAQANAQLQSAEAEVARLEASKVWLKERLALADETIRLEQAELARARDLQQRGIDSARGLDDATRAVVRARDAKLALEQSLALTAPQILAGEARVREAQARVEGAALDLERCRIELPFAGLIAKVAIEAHQRVAPGQVLFELWEVERLEIPVALSLADALLLSERLQRERGVGSVEVRYELPGQVRRWTGEIVRFEPLAGETQTLRAVVAVDAQGAEGYLVPEAFCHVLLEGPPRNLSLALPVSALQEGGRVYLARKDEQGQDRLAIVRARTGLRSGAWVEVLAGIEPGARVVVSPLERAIEGMPLVVSDEPAAGVSK